jgi:ATP adenylyltransferase
VLHAHFSSYNDICGHTNRKQQFQLRYCPSLAKKPTPQKDKDAAQPKKKFNPFANPDQDLFIADIPSTSPTHFLILNKFPIIPEHFILATKTNKAQTHVLEEDDLAMTYACLKEWERTLDDGKTRRLFSFFNSGEGSGASQAHRHLQFLPVESIQDGVGNEEGGWDLLTDRIERSEEGGRGMYCFFHRIKWVGIY